MPGCIACGATARSACSPVHTYWSSEFPLRSRIPPCRQFESWSVEDRAGLGRFPPER
jgi:hypothetical protein